VSLLLLPIGPDDVAHRLDADCPHHRNIRNVNKKLVRHSRSARMQPFN